MPQSRIPDQQLDYSFEDFAPGPIVGIDTPTTNHARVVQSGKKVDMLVNISGTISSSPTELTFTLPVTPVTSGGRKALTCHFSQDSGVTWEVGVCFVTMSDSLCYIQRDGGAAFANASVELMVSGTYEAN